MSSQEENLDRLVELLSQNQFELLLPSTDGASIYSAKQTEALSSGEVHVDAAAEADGRDSSPQGQIRLVYLMNDAVESFLLFKNAQMTGFYDPSFEGELDAELSIQEDGRYLLVVKQEDSVCSIFFQKLELEVHLYNYGRTGHVWMKGQEDLRQIEYWIAITREKLRYLGEEYCSDAEIELSALEEFPPLNVCCYPSVPRKYYEPREDAWVPTEQGIAEMEKLAAEAGDQKLLKQLKRYRKHPGRREAKKIAGMLKKNVHTPVIDWIIEKIQQASAGYPNRTYSAEEEMQFAAIRKRAEIRKMELDQLAGKQKQCGKAAGSMGSGNTAAAGIPSLLVCQEPFTTARDSVDYQVHLILRKPGLIYRKVTVETYS